MTNYKSGDVVLVPFPFVDLSSTKKRPVLILKVLKPVSFPALMIVAMISSQIKGESIPGDRLITDWEKAHLLHPSKIRLAKLVSIEHKMILKKIGRLSSKDKQSVKGEWQRLFNDML